MDSSPTSPLTPTNDRGQVILRIEHRVTDYTSWKRAFDADPLGRASSGVLRHEVQRASDSPDEVTIDLEFATTGEAEAMLTALRPVWASVSGTLIHDVRARVLDRTEGIAY